MASGEYLPIKIDPAFFTPLIISLLKFVHSSKCSGAIMLIVSNTFFLLFVKIAKPKFFKLLEAIFFFGNLINCFFKDRFTKRIKFLLVAINID